MPVATSGNPFAGARFYRSLLGDLDDHLAADRHRPQPAAQATRRSFAKAFTTGKNPGSISPGERSAAALFAPLLGDAFALPFVLPAWLDFDLAMRPDGATFTRAGDRGVQNKGPRLDLLPTGTELHVKRHGEDERFVGSGLRVPAKVLRDREADVLTPRDLAQRHRAYRSRVMIGPTYRADMWAALDADPTLSAASLARSTYGSFAAAWHVKRDKTIRT